MTRYGENRVWRNRLPCFFHSTDQLDRSIRHVQQSSGGIKRLSVAVVVNYRGTLSAQGKRETQALSAPELDQIKNLVKETMGFSSERGDSLNVVNSPFASEPSIETPELPWWRQPDNIELAKGGGKYLLLGIAALYLWFAVLRPLLRNYLQPRQVAMQVADKGEPAFEDAAKTAQDQQGRRHLDNLQSAQETAIKHPRMVAMLIKHWMEKKDG